MERSGTIRAIVQRTARAAAVVVAIGALGADASAAPKLTAERTLLLYNSMNEESRRVRDLYVKARPGVLEFDLADATLDPARRAAAGEITREEFETSVRAPLRAFLDRRDDDGVRLGERVIAIATTRGLPARIAGADEFTLHSSYASVESELALLYQDWSADVSAAPFDAAGAGAVRNPYYGRRGEPIAAFDRASIDDTRARRLVGAAAWDTTGLTPGGMYLVCRLDSAPGGGRDAVANIARLIERSQDLSFTVDGVQAALDGWSPAFRALDADGGLFFRDGSDFAAAAAVLERAGVPTMQDRSYVFIDGNALPDHDRPTILLGTYGVNHGARGHGAAPTHGPNYLETFTNIHPAGVFVAYESFNGQSLIDGRSRDGQQQALDFIARGGSFTVAHVAEPFSFAVADTALLAENLLLGGMTFAEAAYSAIPALSWQSTPIGDPLATVRVVRPGGERADPTPTGAGADARAGVDILRLIAAWGEAGAGHPADLNGDGVVDGIDLMILLTR